MNMAVFKATSTDTSLYFDPLTLNTKGAFSLKLKANISQNAYLKGIETGIAYNKDIVTFGSFVPISKWQLLEQKDENGIIKLALIPRDDYLFEAGEQTIGDINFTSIKDGTTALAIKSADTLVSVYDTTSDPTIYPATVSVQDANILISEAAVALTPTAITTKTYVVEDLAQSLGGQHIISTSALVYPTSAIVLTKIAENGKTKLEFGLDEKLGNKVEETSVGKEHVLKIFGLAPDTRYFYRVSIIDGTNKISGKLLSFKTTIISSEPADADISYMKIAPSKAREEAEIFMVIRDKDGQSATGQKPEISILQGDADFSVAENNGFYYGKITPKGKAKQTVTLQAKVSDKLLEAQTVSFDPTISTAVTTDQVDASNSTTSSGWLIVFSALTVMLVLSLLAFVKALRIK